MGLRRRRPASRRCDLRADPARQARLLQVQALDTRLDQLAHARATLPQRRELADLEQQLAQLGRDVALAQTASDDVQPELAKAEADVQLVRDRAARDRARLDAGTGSAKDLQALQHELVSLARRQTELEDLQLEIMERAETLSSRAEELQAQRQLLEERRAQASQACEAATRALDEEAEQVRSERERLAPAVGEDLLGLYERIRAASGGIGAAELRQRRCEGCRLELNQVELAAIKAAAADEVVRCEECRRILVRTAESGLR